MNTTIHSTKRGIVHVTAQADVPVLCPPDSCILWAEIDDPWSLVIGDHCPDAKLRKLAEREGFDFDELVRARDELARRAA